MFHLMSKVALGENTVYKKSKKMALFVGFSNFN